MAPLFFLLRRLLRLRRGDRGRQETAVRDHETMVPARNLLRRQYNCYGGFLSADSSFCSEKLRSPENMAEERSRGFAAGGFVNGREEGEEEEEEEEEEAGPEAEASKSSRGGEEVEEEGWLRLGIGVGVTTSMSPRSPAKSSSTAARRRELDLFERSSTAPSAATGVGSMMPVFHACGARQLLPPRYPLGILETRQSCNGVRHVSIFACCSRYATTAVHVSAG
ncbi:hypothetical protein HPP92_023033 [Vanilla planifolia]|uniref:Uncharacterized protein n=1 Tax=Vanilla planifolia TaxID=51239 RepID=A0A835PT24_VANPL|nr:hypothetical protein HPP92_023033 [Vanilla planifolia]